MKQKLFFLSLIGILFAGGLFMAASLPVKSDHPPEMAEDMWKPPHTDSTILGLGTDDEPLSVDHANMFDNYDAILTQASTNPPTQSIMHNTISDADGTWSRSNAGIYNLDFDAETFVVAGSTCSCTIGNATGFTAKCYIVNDSTVRVTVLDAAASGVDLVGTAFLQVRRYDGLTL